MTLYWIATGNNVALDGDMATGGSCLFAKDAGVERPTRPASGFGRCHLDGKRVATIGRGLVTAAWTLKH